MYAPGARLLAPLLLLAAAVPSPAGAESGSAHQLGVVAPGQHHVAWAGAQHLARMLAGSELPLRPALLAQPDAETDDSFLLIAMPVRDLAPQVPALEVLELPFLFPTVEAVHDALDRGLGERLREEARRQGWEILAFWDEGMHQLSGQRRYNEPVNLNGTQLLLRRADPMADRQFLALQARTRPAEAETRAQLHQEYRAAGRAATLQQLRREGLYRVHRALTLSNHRYEGWVLAMPASQWAQLSASQRAALRDAAERATAWQRREAKRREEAALQSLTAVGMQIHMLSPEQRRKFLLRLLPLDGLLPKQLSVATKSSLLALAIGTGADAHLEPTASLAH